MSRTRQHTKTALFIDIDGTICRTGRRPSPTLYKALSAFRGQGHYAFLCTGRTRAQIPPEIHALGFDGIVSALGAHVQLGEEVLLDECIPHALLCATVKSLMDHGVQGLVSGDRVSYRLPGEWRGLFEAADTLTRAGYARQLAGMRVSTMDFHYPDASQLNGCMDLLSMHSELVGYDANNAQSALLGCDKATGIELILSRLSEEGVTTVGIGDSQNDIGMLQCVDVGVAMGDAPPEVKQEADIVTGTVEQNGVAQALALLYTA